MIAKLQQIAPKRLKDIHLLTGFHIILFIFLLVFIQSLLYALHIAIAWWLFPVTLSLVTLSLWCLYDAKLGKKLIGAGLFLLFIISAIGLSGYVLDNSYDGNAYHKAAIGSLAHGWNPVWSSLDTFNNQTTTSPKLTETHALWTDHYPKAQWIYSAVVYKATGTIESGKSLLLLLMAATFLILYSYLKKRLTWLLAGVISLLAVGNPVAIAQVFSYYNDGILVTLLLLFVTGLVMTIDKSRKLSQTYIYIDILLIMSCALLVNIKFTGAAYAAIYALIFAVFILWKRNDYKGLRAIKRLAMAGCAAIIIGIFIIGLSTYPKNFIKNHHPLYPLYGSGSVDIISFLEPPGFSDKSRIEKLSISLFSPSSSGTNPQDQAPKLPFSVSKEEVDSLRVADTHLGGFGVFFGGIVLLSALLCIIYVKDGYRLLRNGAFSAEAALLLIPLIATVATVALLSESWWARYVPQLYWLPVLLVILLAIKKKKIVATSLAIIMLSNFAIIAYAQVTTNYQATSLHRQQINFLKSRCYKSPEVITGAFSGNAYNLYDACYNISLAKSPPEGKKSKTVYDTKIYY